jgi:hypothetical protein
MEFNFGLKCPFTRFSRKTKRAPTLCMDPWGATSVCEHIIGDAYDKRITIIKTRETYVLSAKTRTSSLENQNVRFG